MLRTFALGGTFALCASTLVFNSAIGGDTDDCNGQAPDRVVRGCSAIIQQKPSSQIALSVLYTRRGIARSQMGQYDTAVADFNEAIRQNPKNPEPLFQRALTLVKKAEIAKTKDGLADAIRDLTAAIEIDARPAFLAQRGYVYLQNNEDDNAIVDDTKAIEKAPRFALAYLNRAAAFIKKQNCAAALRDSTEAINLDPQNDKPYLSKAICLEKFGRYAEAVPTLNEAVRLNPANSMAYFERGRTFFFLNRLDEAIADDSKSIQLQPTANAYSNRGIVYLHKRMMQEAIADLDKAIEMDKTNSLSLYSRAIVHVIGKNFGRAESDIEDAVNKNPLDAKTLYVRSIIRYAVGKQDGGRDDYDTALRLDPKLREVGAPETMPIDYFANWPFVPAASVPTRSE